MVSCHSHPLRIALPSQVKESSGGIQRRRICTLRGVRKCMCSCVQVALSEASGLAVLIRQHALEGLHGTRDVRDIHRLRIACSYASVRFMTWMQIEIALTCLGINKSRHPDSRLFLSWASCWPNQTNLCTLSTVPPMHPLKAEKKVM